MQKLITISILFIIISKSFANPFEYAQSTLQSAFFIYEITIDEQEIDPQDWVGAFCNDICVSCESRAC